MVRIANGQEGEDGELDSSDEEDDTDPLWACPDAPKDPPDGFTYAACPVLESDQNCRELIGRKVFVAHDRTKSLEPDWSAETTAPWPAMPPSPPPPPPRPSPGNPLDHGPCQVCWHDQALWRLERVEEDGPDRQLRHQVQQEADG